MNASPATLAIGYARAISALQRAEAAHVKLLDALQQASTDHDGARAINLRSEARKSEGFLQAALAAACSAHGAYWQARRDAMRDEALQAAAVLRRYDAVCHVAGELSAEPHKVLMQDVPATPLDALITVDAVPFEQPDSGTLEMLLGSWRDMTGGRLMPASPIAR